MEKKLKKTLVAVSLTALIMSTLFFGVAATTSNDLNGVVAKLGSMVTSLNGIRTDIQNLGTTMGGAAQTVREPFAMRFEDGDEYTVPDGKRLTVEMVSFIRVGSLAVSDMTPPAFTAFVVWNTDGQEGIFYFGAAATSYSATSASAAGTFYPDGISVSGGGTIRIQALSYSFNGNDFEGYSITGYLEDL
jgi:hypothetical protein